MQFIRFRLFHYSMVGEAFSLRFNDQLKISTKNADLFAGLDMNRPMIRRLSVDK